MKSADEESGRDAGDGLSGGELGRQRLRYRRRREGDRRQRFSDRHHRSQPEKQTTFPIIVIQRFRLVLRWNDIRPEVVLPIQFFHYGAHRYSADRILIFNWFDWLICWLKHSRRWWWGVQTEGVADVGHLAALAANLGSGGGVFHQVVSDARQVRPVRRGYRRRRRVHRRRRCVDEPDVEVAVEEEPFLLPLFHETVSWLHLTE